MVDVAIRAAHQQIGFLRHQAAKCGLIVGVQLACILQNSARLRELGGVIYQVAHMKQHHFTHHFTHFPAGINVVADIAHAIGRKLFAIEFEHGALHFGRYPAINAVGDDVIVLLGFLRQIQNVGLAEGDVPDVQLALDFIGVINLYLGQISAHELRIRILHRHRQQIAAERAAEFQHPCLGKTRRGHAKEFGHATHARGMGLRERKRFVRYCVVIVDLTHRKFPGYR